MIKTTTKARRTMPAEQPVTPTPTAKPERTLNNFQIKMIDLFGDWLMNGTAGAYSRDLLMTLGAMEWERLFGRSPLETRDALDEQGAKHARSVFNEWYKTLIGVWPNGEPNGPAPAPKNVTEIIQLNNRHRLEENLNIFRYTANPEEVVFMVEVLEIWNSESHWSFGDPVEEIHIATALNDTLTGTMGNVYIKVPEEMVELIQKLVKAKAA
jgi:hypothetical protein